MTWGFSLTKVALAAFCAGSLALAGCSGGGGSSSPRSPTPTPTPIPAPTPPAAPTWTAGVFEASSRFEARCEVPRVGVDIEGNSFPDRAGSLVEENFWLRSWTNETYLWNDEVVDRDPATFSDRLDYFAVLRTTEVTPSGKDKDDFHFSQPTDEYLEQRNSTPRAAYGLRLAAFSVTPPRDYRVLYTEPGSPAAEVVAGQANFQRGSRILEIDGIDLVNANTDAELDLLNLGLFPLTAGETHTFVVQDEGSAVTRTFQIQSANISPKPVNRTQIINTTSGDVGYILFNTFSPFSSEEEIANAFTAMKAAGISDVILDLRYNGGGLLAVASQLAYLVAGDGPTLGRDFERLRFNASSGNRNPVTGSFDNSLPFFRTGIGFSLAEGTPLDTLSLPRVYILTTDNTCSASESVINGLRGIGVEVILIGSKTCGKPFGFYPEDNCGETYYTIQFQGVNHLGFGDYADGFIPSNSSEPFGVRAPGCAVSDDFSAELGDETEAMLAAALAFRATGACPAPPISARSFDPNVLRAPVGDFVFLEADANPARIIRETNRDMTMPNP